MKTRPPTQREKKRYLLFRINPSWASPDSRDLTAAIHEGVTSLYGDSEAARIHVTLIMHEGDMAIVRCLRGTEGMLTAALMSVQEIGGWKVGIRTLATSGTLCAIRRHIPLPCPRVPWNEGDVGMGARTYEVIDGGYSLDGRVDLIEKGFNRQELLFLIREDI